MAQPLGASLAAPKDNVRVVTDAEISTPLQLHHERYYCIYIIEVEV